MGYLFLMIALLTGATKGYCGKKISGYVSKPGDAFFMNLIRMVLCIGISFVTICFSGGIHTLIVEPRVLILTALSGITTSAFVIVWVFCVQKGAYMMVDVFLIPILSSTFLFKERLEIYDIIGFLLLVVAALVMCSYNNSIKAKMSFVAVGLLILCAVANGGSQLAQKLFAVEYPDGSVAAFNFYTYVFSALVLFICRGIYNVKNHTTQKMEKSIVGYITIMAICLFANSFFLTLAAKSLHAVVIYPLDRGLSIVLSALMAAVFFKEKISIKCVIGMVLAFIGLLVINF